MRYITTLFYALLFLYGRNAVAQNTAPPAYYGKVNEAEELYRQGEYQKSGIAYSEAFATFGGLGYMNNRYDAACSWAQAGYADSAFYNLQRIINKGFNNFIRAENQADFDTLHTLPQWQPLLAQMQLNFDSANPNINKPLFIQISMMANEDQKWRHKAVGYVADPVIGRKMRETDSLHYPILKSIFEQYGYPNYKLVGKDGEKNFWLLMQHQDEHPEFQAMVLSAMQKEVEAKQASAANHAYLTDRVLVNTGQKQVYGTQLKLNTTTNAYECLPVIEPEKLNERRKSVGLGPIERYIDHLNNEHSHTK